MIVTRLAGGLGNQLFQYAIAKALSLKLNTVMVMDASYYQLNRSRNMELGKFNIKDPRFEMVIPAQNLILYKEPHFHYDENYQTLESPNVYLVGFWQSEKYFKHIKSVLLNELQIKSSLVSSLEIKSFELQNEESVSVHIRRGDYKSSRHANSHGFLSLQYYYSAMELLAAKRNNLKFYFFSDEIEWVQNNVKIDYPHEFLSNHLSKSNIEDFFLMNSCKHNIIANSTFSWWAAWLKNSQEQIVIAPNQWVNGKEFICDDVVPENWITIPAS